MPNHSGCSAATGLSTWRVPKELQKAFDLEYDKTTDFWYFVRAAQTKTVPDKGDRAGETRADEREPEWHRPELPILWMMKIPHAVHFICTSLFAAVTSVALYSCDEALPLHRPPASTPPCHLHLSLPGLPVSTPAWILFTSLPASRCCLVRLFKCSFYIEISMECVITGKRNIQTLCAWHGNVSRGLKRNVHLALGIVAVHQHPHWMKLLKEGAPKTPTFLSLCGLSSMCQ
ncbi:uncharacterized protein LOC134760194 [Pongo abelii]|uniref:uncharacterized protein LOC134760194 n=1 Tax=Pongo abelii TaxID=9601 RepID=UPI003005ED07